MCYPLFAFVLLLPIGSLEASDTAETPSHRTAETKPAVARMTTVVRLKNIPAASTAIAITNFLKAKRGLARLQIGSAPVTEFVIAPDTSTNSLFISAAKADVDEIAALIERVDQTPDQIVIPLEISIVGPEGKTRVLSRPQVRTLNGQQAFIDIGLDDGSRLKIELTPRVVRDDKDEG